MMPEPTKGNHNQGLDKMGSRQASDLLYEVDEAPPVLQTLLMGLQTAVANIFVASGMALFISNLICADEEFAASLYTTTAVACGLATILQTALGIRLPIFQGPSNLYLIPILAARDDPRWMCNHRALQNLTELNISLADNITITSTEDPWMPEWRKIQGSLMVASAGHMLVGLLGLSGLIMRVLGPISISVIILLLGLSLKGIVTGIAEIHWGIAAVSILVIVVMCQYLARYDVPMPSWNRGSGFHMTSFPLFEVYPFLMSVLLTWFICYILTIAGALTDDPSDVAYKARTDASLGAIYTSPVFKIPYPGEYGMPEFRVDYVLMFLIASLGSILESISDYVQAAAACHVAKPPTHAINRGVLMEGFSTLISGALGAGHATTSYSNLIGMISITKVASRRVMITGGVMMILLGILGKVGAIFVSIPLPALTGQMFVGLGLLIGCAISNLDLVDLKNMRNLSILGISLLAGTAIPDWIVKNSSSLNTGVETVDILIKNILGTPMVFGGIVACFLDSTIAGNHLHKAIHEIRVSGSSNTALGKVESISHDDDVDDSIYDPPFIGARIRSWKISRYLQFLPYDRRPKTYRVNGDCAGNDEDSFRSLRETHI